MKLLITIFIFLNATLISQSISVTSDWNFTVPSSGVIEAGEDFEEDEYVSSINEANLDIYHSDKWKVKVNKVEIYWHEDLKLRIRRTGDGLGPGIIDGGEGFVEVKTNDLNDFCRGEKDRLFIPLQYRIENVTVLMPATVYSADIIYTLIDD